MLQIDIMDLAGHIIQYSQQNVDDGFNIISVDIQALSKGLYLERVKDEKNQVAFVKVSKF